MYIFLQQYWWLIVSLLGAILVFLLFVQGGNSLLFCLGKTEEHRKMLVNSTGRKWEFTFTTLVTFGGAFFASFPLFYSTSFGGAYWLWMIILFSFVLQAVSYEFQSKAGNLLGKKTYQTFLVINGVVGPLLLGGAVATFFTGSDFYINKANMTDTIMPVISHWGNGWHGQIEEAYGKLHEMGFAHSVECWDEEGLQGGLYGVALGKAFFGESMFHRKTDASKIALVALVQYLRAHRFLFLDTQWTTPHLLKFGTYEVPAEEYRKMLKRALAG